MKLGCNQAETRQQPGGVKDSETPSGGVSQPVIEGSGASVLRVELVCAG